MAQVVPIYPQIQALNTEVLTISFGSVHWAQIWLRETRSPFPFLIDRDRSVYQKYGLRASIFSTWSPKNLFYYLRAVLQGRETFGRRGNPHQLGGDFIVDRDSIIRLAHPSQDPTDRPSIDALIGTLRQIN